MKAMAFTEHGSVMEWRHTKCAIEEAGMKLSLIHISMCIRDSTRDGLDVTRNRNQKIMQNFEKLLCVDD